MNKHTPTPTPWFTEYRKIYGSEGYAQQIFDKDGRDIADLSWYPVAIENGHTTNREANAKHIVKCVNMHKDLINFVEDIITYAGNNCDDYLANKARDILNKVEEFK